MVKHGFIIGWVIAWILVTYWKQYIESKIGFWWSIAFFFLGLILGTIVQTLMDKAEERRKRKEAEGEENRSVYNNRY
jgi:hypothetical protein